MDLYIFSPRVTALNFSSAQVFLRCHHSPYQEECRVLPRVRENSNSVKSPCMGENIALRIAVKVITHTDLPEANDQNFS